MTDIETIYKLNNQTSDQVFQIIQFWSPFCKEIIGKKLQLAIDETSICLAKTEKTKFNKKVKFLINSAIEKNIEALIWLDKARVRKLILKKDYKKIYINLKKIEENLSKLNP